MAFAKEKRASSITDSAAVTKRVQFVFPCKGKFLSLRAKALVCPTIERLRAGSAVRGNDTNTLFSKTSCDRVFERQYAPYLQRWRWVAVLGLMALGLASASLSRAGVGAGPLTYAYDALGRLVAVVDGSGNAGVYTYDAVGNLLNIQAPPANTVAIFTFAPNNGPAGKNFTVTIYGDWFSATASQNTVKFNGTTAAVSQSTIAAITTTLPAGATSGFIQVTVAGVGTVTSSSNFNLTANLGEGGVMRNHRYVLCVAGLVLGLVAASAPVSANYINGTTVPPATGPTPDEACLPMGSQLWQRWSYCDVAAGLFSFSQVDMTVAGPMPIVLRRVYRSQGVNTSGNAVLEPFGNGMNFDYNISLWSPSEAANGTLSNVDVILANGAQVICACQGNGNCTPGSGLQFQCKATPSQTFYGATIQYDSSPQSWVLTTKDQTQYSFSYGQSQGSILQSITDRYGNSITINRQMPNLWLVTSSNGRQVSLGFATINGEKVITQAQDSAGRITSYGYTTYGSGSNQTSMTSSTDPNGKTINYTWYTPEDMGSIKPSQNNGLLVEETDIGYTALGSGYQFTYLTPPQSQGYYQITYTMNGSEVTAADISDPMTYPRQVAFNSSGYVTSETLNNGAGGGTPSETATYTRDANSNFVTDKVDALGPPYALRLRFHHDQRGRPAQRNPALQHLHADRDELQLYLHFPPVGKYHRPTGPYHIFLPVLAGHQRFHMRVQRCRRQHHHFHTRTHRPGNDRHRPSGGSDDARLRSFGHRRFNLGERPEWQHYKGWL